MSEHLYTTDFYAWTQQQAHALQEQDWAAVDVAYVAAVLEGLGRAQEAIVRRYLGQLIFQALTWAMTRTGDISSGSCPGSSCSNEWSRSCSGIRR